MKLNCVKFSLQNCLKVKKSGCGQFILFTQEKWGKIFQKIHYRYPVAFNYFAAKIK